MRTRLAAKLCIAAVLFLGALPARAEVTCLERLPVQDGARVLWIGNSLVGGGSTEGIAGWVQHALGQGQEPTDIQIGRMTLWGLGLYHHYTADSYVWTKHNNPHYYTNLDPTDRTAVQMIRDGLDGKPWDVVFLQDYTHDGKPEQAGTLFKYARKFDLLIRQCGGQPVFFMRWSDNPYVFEGLTPKEGGWSQRQTPSLVENYTRIGRELGDPVVPLAVIWRDLYENPPAALTFHEDNGKYATYPVKAPEGGPPAREKFLYRGDNIHQAASGEAVNTYAFYAMLTGRSPEGLPLTFDDYDENANPEVDAAIEQRVWKHLAERVGRAGESSGKANAAYDAATGDLTVTISGRVIGLRVGTPGFGDGKGKLLHGAFKLGEYGPVQSDTEVLAYYAEDGLPPGTYQLAGAVQPGTPVEEVFFAFTPATGPTGQGIPTQ